MSPAEQRGISGSAGVGANPDGGSWGDPDGGIAQRAGAYYQQNFPISSGGPPPLRLDTDCGPCT